MNMEKTFWACSILSASKMFVRIGTSRMLIGGACRISS